MWAAESVFYQIYPLGFCGAPFENDGILVSRIRKAADWIPHLKKLGISAVYFAPVFESDTHGYNTRDFGKIDVRLGTNEDFAYVCREFHQSGIRIILDGVFNHVGRGFWAFRDVQEKREKSRYADWFHLRFDGESRFQDGFWYEGWEGNDDLVRLNLQNEEVIQHILDNVREWVRLYEIDGLRLDVAYCLDRNFIKRLRSYCDNLKQDFFLLGEMLNGDYNQLMNDEMLHSVTNYECYKGLYSSFNSGNMFEIMHSLLRQFGPENWTLYKGKHLFCFVDNHDVTRVASILQQEQHIPLIYAMMFAMPGIPCIYYGSEWGAKAKKEEGDPALRPCFEKPEWNQLTGFLAGLAAIHTQNQALLYGSFRSVYLTNLQCIFERQTEEETILFALNASSEEAAVSFGEELEAEDLISGQQKKLQQNEKMAPYSVNYWKVRKF